METRRACAAIAGATMIIVALLCIGGFLWLAGQSDFSGQVPAAENQAGEAKGKEAAIDWDRWRSINADVVGWIQIPGTDINQPLVQSRKNDPTRYLHLNVYGNPSPFGCPYLDFRNQEKGLASDNCLIYGHHLDTGGVFSDLCRYLDETWAAKHPTVLLHTPEGMRTLQVRFARKVRASSYVTRTGFSKRSDFEAWWNDERSLADMTLEKNEGTSTESTAPQQVVSLITCAEGYDTDWRVIVFVS